MTNNLHTYWQQPPTAQRTIIESIEEQCQSEEAERERIVGYATTIEAPDSTMYPKGEDRDVIVCMDCFGDPKYRPDVLIWDPIAKEEYLDKDSTAFKAKCEDCGRRLLPEHPFE